MPYAIHLLLWTQHAKSFPVFDCILHSMQHAMSDNLLHWEFSVAFVRSSVGSLVLLGKADLFGLLFTLSGLLVDFE